ncbi:hypothetical protein SME36J_46280 [Serratia marcescens]|nr:hypothetical protein SME36J_46280 [Serratia marcescens]
MVGEYNFTVLRITLILVFTLGLVGCPETPSKSLREQVRDAENISGYKSEPAVSEKKRIRLIGGVQNFEFHLQTKFIDDFRYAAGW